MVVDLFVVDVGAGIFCDKPRTLQKHTLVYVPSYGALGEMIRTTPNAVVLSDVRNNLKAVRSRQPKNSRLVVFDSKWSTYAVLRGLHQQASGFLESNDEKSLCTALGPILAGQIVMCRKATRAVKCLVNTFI